MPKVLRQGLIVKDDWVNSGTLFGYHQLANCNTPPDWHFNQLSGKRSQHSDRPWYEIPDFVEGLGDIKGIWELSRMDWLLPWSQRAALGDEASLQRMNHWLSDWCQHNPPYRGTNWKCGQEASIRVIHLALAARFLKQVSTASSELKELLTAHLKRIEPTISYAVGQANNHGTSEAAALLIGGSWLEQLGDKTAARWTKLGLKWLNDRARRLISYDGTFSQYSVNYHRLMLDSYCVVMLWQRSLNLPTLSALSIERLRAATDWITAMVDPNTGYAPNIGANDGANLLPISCADYRDYRPTVALAHALLFDKAIHNDLAHVKSHLTWLDIAPSERVDVQIDTRTLNACDGGFAVMNLDQTRVVFRFPNFRFRPSQADCLHVDITHSPQNICPDAGTYSYNSPDGSEAYYSGTIGHNTVQFDNRDQMPKLGRFLFGDWLKCSQLAPLKIADKEQSIAAGYRDAWGASHLRSLRLRPDELLVQDQVSGFRQKAVLRWRLKPGPWELYVADRVRLSNSEFQIELNIGATMKYSDVILTEGWESSYYGHRSSLPVLEVSFDRPGTIESTFTFNKY